MTWLDTYLASVRVAKALDRIPAGARVLDVGSFDGELFVRGQRKGISGIGVDPELPAHRSLPNAELLRDSFPVARDIGKFDCVTALAVLEHIPLDQQDRFATACLDALHPGGRIILTVPSPRVDDILAILMRLRLVHGMSAEQHFGFDASRTPALFEKAGARLVRHSSFQLGLNNVFVFEKPRVA